MRKSTGFFYLLILAGTLLCKGCGDSPQVIVFHAGSLSRLMSDLKAGFEAANPGVEVILEASGSIPACRKTSELHRQADIIAVSDSQVIERLLYPKFSDWSLVFAGNKMGIAYGEHSKYGEEINSDNWFEILSRKDVKLGRADPDLDPCGYRTLFCWKLSDVFYQEKLAGKSIAASLEANCPPANMRPFELELVALLQSYALDYVFIYESIARQFNLKFVDLPDKINLGTTTEAAFYSSVDFQVNGGGEKEFTVSGQQICYAFTIPESAPHPQLALKFGEFMLKSREISDNFYQTVEAASLHPENLPRELRKLLP
ncbi:MAG: tungstate ABC transporter substrate-binding protein WtpA [Candidatus Wallbacteria bacterium]|nr:tungstate ABC transporter substrate-binding protein WtpA [Candidatus Wallbacteria bacterium]